MGLARYSALNIYFFGRGQKIALPWGERWRLTAVARGSGLAAVLVNEGRAAPGHGRRRGGGGELRHQRAGTTPTP